MANTSFLSSDLFKVIGPGKTTFNVHGRLLAKKSKVLSKDVNGTMRESQIKTIEIEAVDGDIDDDTVMRFLEYLYTGDYPVPDPVVLQLPSDSREVAAVFSSKGWTQAAADEGDVYRENIPSAALEPTFRTKGKGKIKKRGNDWYKSSAFEPEESFEHEEFPESLLLLLLLFNDGTRLVHRTPEVPLTAVRESDPFKSGKTTRTRAVLWKAFCSSADPPQSEAWLPPANNDQREDFTSIFLCHARLYKFSDRCECPKLMDLSLQQLRLTFSRSTFHQERASAIVELI